MSNSSRYVINWVLTHEPIALFEEAAREFQEIVAKQSGGRMEVRVMTPTEYGNGQRVSPLEVAKQVASGELQMSQTYTVALGKLHPRLWALDLPFLFRSHDHASEVLDGDIGRELLSGLRPHGIRGLAFTYSGGYRIISSTERELERCADLTGLRVRTSDNPVVQSYMRALGATPVPAPLYEIPRLTEAGEIDAAESTWPRYWDMGHHQYQRIVNETAHSLFLTALVVNDEFYNGLPEDLQRVLCTAALQIARFERDKSVRDGETSRLQHLAQQGRVTNMPLAETARMEAAAESVWQEFAPSFGQDLLDRITACGQRQAG